MLGEERAEQICFSGLKNRCKVQRILKKEGYQKLNGAEKGDS